MLLRFIRCLPTPVSDVFFSSFPHEAMELRPLKRTLSHHVLRINIYGKPFQKNMEQPGMVSNPTHGQVDRGK